MPGTFSSGTRRAPRTTTSRGLLCRGTHQRPDSLPLPLLAIGLASLPQWLGSEAHLQREGPLYRAHGCPHPFDLTQGQGPGRPRQRGVALALPSPLVARWIDAITACNAVIFLSPLAHIHAADLPWLPFAADLGRRGDIAGFAPKQRHACPSEILYCTVQY
jgi:hypothetical protein